MSYTEKYKLEWVDYFEQANEVLIEEQDYWASSSDIKGTRSPISLTWETPSDFLFDPINGSSMTMRLIAETDFQFSDLYTANNRKYRVTHNLDSSLNWRGFILPDQYQEEYKPPPYVSEFIATDQLGYLKTQYWDKTSVISDLEALEIILGATDLEFDLQEGLNIYDSNHSSTVADSPLNQTYYDAEVFTGKSLYEVLYQILFKYSAIIKQRSGEWFIFRPREASTSYTLRKWTLSSGTYSYDSNQSYNPVVSSTSSTVAEASLVRLRQGTMFIRPAWQKYTLKQILGLKDSFIENHDFTRWTGTLPDDWSVHGSVTYSRNGNRLRIKGATSNWNAKWVDQSVTFGQHGGGHSIRMRVKFHINIPTGETMNVRFGIFVNTLGWYDPDTDTWPGGVGANYIGSDYDNSGGSVTIKGDIEIDFTTPALADTVGYALLRIFTPDASATDCYIDIDEAGLSLVRYISASETKDYDNEQEHADDINLDNNYVPNDMEILQGDVPVYSPNNAKNIWNGVLFSDVAQTTATYDWTADGRTRTLAGLTGLVFTDLFQYPQQVISTQIYSKLIDSCTVLQEVNNANKLFLIKRATWESHTGYWEVEMHQLPAAVGESRILLETGDFILLEDGSKIIRE